MIIRPKVREFVSFLLQHFCCVVWSSMTVQNLMPLLRLLLRETGDSESSFCFIYDQRHCVKAPNVHHPSKPGVPLLTKPFSSIEVPFDMYNTLLIDDTPEKAMYNLEGTCISPAPYDGSSDDDMLEVKLIPYLTSLYYSKLSVDEFVLQNPFL